MMLLIVCQILLYSTGFMIVLLLYLFKSKKINTWKRLITIINIERDVYKCEVMVTWTGIKMR